MIRDTFPVGMLRCNCTILGDEPSRKAVVIDPGADIPVILAHLHEHELEVQKIIVTHAHIDHIAGALELKRITGAPVFYNKSDLPLVAIMEQQAAWLGVDVPDVQSPDHSPADNEIIRVGNVDLQVLHTPGHTQGSLCLRLSNEALLIAGDTLFAGSVGRTDLPGGNHAQLIASIRERLLLLPPETVVIPGHGAATTIGEERRTNLFLIEH